MIEAFVKLVVVLKHWWELYRAFQLPVLTCLKINRILLQR